MTTDARTVSQNYPKPHVDNTLSADMTRLIQALEAIGVDVASLLTQVASKALATHNHTVAEVTGLQTILDGKKAESWFPILDELSDVDVTGATNGQFLRLISGFWQPATLSVDWTNISSKPSSFSTTWTDVSGKPTTFTPATHNHAISEVTGLSSSLTALASRVITTTDLENQAVTPAKLTFGAWTVVPSAATVDLGARTSRNITISGTTTITSFGSTATPDNVSFNVRFTDSLLIINSPNLFCPGYVNLAIVAGDVITVSQLAPGVWCILGQTFSFNSKIANLGVGALGQYAFLALTTGGTIDPGGNVAGSNLSYDDNDPANGFSNIPSGIWLVLGRISSGYRATLMQRIV